MFSKIEKFKATAWEKAGRYDTGHKRRVLLAVLIGIGTIAWLLIRFIGATLNAILVDDKKDKWSFLRSLEEQAAREEHEKDVFERKPGDPFYGEPMSDMMIWQGIEESKDNWKM